jgi:hypothetical protein
MAASTPSARAALDELVHQFADPYAFVRELIQNAVDAGSAEIHVDVRHATEGPDAGLVTVHVDDWGEGMTREVIEKKLTRLFSSSKDGDRTKIGKFGIGFVSVFALDPDAVCIDTARDGQCWRVLFRADRTFELLALRERVDGTKIRVIKRGDAERFAEIRARVEASLRFWCRHLEAEVRFAGVPIRAPFTLEDAPCQVSAGADASRIVVGHRSDRSTFRGFYNSGLTLLESTAARPGDPLDGLGFKVSSPRLEHTLTRDAVIEDAGFHGVLRDVEALARTPLAEAVFDALERASTGPASHYLVHAALWHLARGLPPGLGARAVASSPGGAPLRIDALRRVPKDGAFLFAPVRSPVTDALEQRGHTVVLGSPDDARAALLLALAPGATAIAVAARWCLPRVLDPTEAPPPWPRLREHLDAALRIAGAKVRDVVAADFVHPDSSIAERIAVTQATPGELTSLDELETLKPGLFTRRHALLVNLGHPSVAAFVTLAEREPAMAAYLCLKAFRLGRDLDAAMDTALVEHLVEQRWPTT